MDSCKCSYLQYLQPKYDNIKALAYICTLSMNWGEDSVSEPHIVTGDVCNIVSGKR